MNCENMSAISENLDAVNRCQIAGLKRAGLTLDPVLDCAEFYKHVRNVQSAIIHTYQLKAYAAVRLEDPKEAATLWREMTDFCNSALEAISELRSKHPQCGTAELYDLALDYKAQAEKRYYENLKDSECQPVPEGLFARTM